MGGDGGARWDKFPINRPRRILTISANHIIQHIMIVMNDSHRLTFRKRHRLSGTTAFQRVFLAKCRKNAGPLVVYGRPNEINHMRLGLSVNRRVGTAVKRNKIKRLLREVFRLQRHDWPRGYDLVVVVRPHETLSLSEYQKLLFRAVRGIHLEWEKRARTSAQKE